jgi:hypothetical protein
MNAIESILRRGCAVHLAPHLQEGETYLVGPGGVKGPGETPRALRRLIDDLRGAAPDDTRLTAWFSISRRGGRVHGEVAIDTGIGTPALVWSPDASEVRLVYRDSVTVSFPSVSDQMVAMAEPMGVVRSGPCGERTARIVETLGYDPQVPFGEEPRVSFSHVDLVRVGVAA